MKTTPELAQALANLRPSHDFAVVLEAFARARKEARDKLETATADDKLGRLQGEAGFIKNFLKIYESAARDLEAFKRNK